MLIYNYQKEFMGIDAYDLENFGLSSLAQLQEETVDFADLFVKTPGYIHNFKHVHWIDYITCGNDNDDRKVIIHINDKNYRAILDIKTIYLIDNPSKEAYQVNFTHLRELTAEENMSVTGDISKKTTPKTISQAKPIINTPSKKTAAKNDKPTQNEQLNITHDPYELKTHEDVNVAQTSVNNDIDVVEDIYEDTYPNKEILGSDIPTEEIEDIPEQELEDYSEEGYFQNVQENTQQEEAPTKEIDLPQVKQNTQIIEEEDDELADYVFDPKIASEELGLPIDLIEEFIQDFISQAKDFRDKLYQAVDEADLDNIKILSHKLKGVAANLRIENAFKTLADINTSSDYAKIKRNLDKFYIIIAKLSGEDEEKFIEELSHANDDIEISFKDEDIPEKIDVLELADDDFLNTNEEKDLSVIDDIGLTMDSKDEDIYEIEKDETSSITNTQDTTLSDFVYNKNNVANEIGINLEDFNALFEDFLHESKKLCNDINKAINNNQPEFWNKCAVQFKGMSDNMRVNVFKEDLESLMNTKDIDTAKNALNKIVQRLKQISSMEG